MKTSRKVVSLGLVVTLFAMGCRGMGSGTGENEGALAVSAPVTTTPVSASAPDGGDDETTCVAPYDVGDPDDDTCSADSVDAGTASVDAGTVSAAPGTVEAFALFTTVHSTAADQCSKERADCINNCNKDLEAGSDTCVKGVFGLTAAEITAITALARTFKVQLLRACSPATWQNILRGSGVAILALIVIAAADYAIFAACSRLVRRNYNACIATCPAN
jgi:hypothetical protein